MSPARSRKAAGALRGRRRERGLPLDATALEAIERFVRVLARSGGSRIDIARALAGACRRIPKSATPKGSSANRELTNASHILTVWFSDPLYLARDGKPMRLTLQGAAPSLEALVHRVDPALDAKEVLRYLLRAHVLRRQGTRYSPRKRALSLRGTEGPTNFRNLRGLVGILRTLEHNLLPKRQASSWFEYFAENPRFPVKDLAAFDARLDHFGMKFLHAIDGDMHRREMERRPGDPTVRVGVGLYRFEDDGAELEPVGTVPGSEQNLRRRNEKERRTNRRR